MSDSKRPHWQTQDCPKWCRQEHSNHDHPDDRFHIGDPFGTPLTMEPFYGMTKLGDVYEPESFEAELFQGYREAEPHVTFGFRHGAFGVRLTLKEAERLAYILASLTNIARDTEEPETVWENLDDQEQWR